MTVSFQSRLCPASRIPAYREEDYWVWCGSPVLGEDGRYHLFASRWSRAYSFFQWATHSEIVRAVSDTPQGPYRYEETVLPPRGEDFWDGRVTHNPAVRKHGDRYLLFYTGATFRGKRADFPRAFPDAQWAESWNHKRVGLAVSNSVFGPWERADAPVLDVCPGAWDSVITSNPAPWVHDDGSVTLIYKSTDVRHTEGPFAGRFHLGCARACHWSKPFARCLDRPVAIRGCPDHHLEDAFIWWNGEGYELIAKDMTGELCGEVQAAIHAVSEDALSWRPADPVKAYSRTVQWDDGSRSTLDKMERPQLFIENEIPRMLFNAVMKRSASGDVSDTYTQAIPLTLP